MGDDMKMTVQLFIETNRSFIQEKTYNTFRIQCVKDKELKDLDVQKMATLLKQMFSFKGNPDMNIFFERAPDNIQKYITEQYKVTSEMDDLIIDIEKLMGIIYYCVDHGFETKEEVKQEIKEEKEVKEEKMEQKKEEVKEQNSERQPIRNRIIKKPVQEEEEVVKEKVKKIYLPKPKTPEKKVFIEKHSMPQKKMPPRYLSVKANQTIPKKEEEEFVPPVPPINLSFIEKHRKLIEGRLERLFRHYCTQQQNLGANTTFDRIKHECEMMTVGKFLLFCKNTCIFSDKAITKLFLTSKFKKISEGFKEIGFEKFKELMSEIDEEYFRVKKQKVQGDIASYEARLFLQSKNFEKMKKDVDLPFTTRQKNGRQLEEYATISHHRYETSPAKKELTTHSGRFSKDLQRDLQIKLSEIKEKKEKKRGNKESKIVKLENISEYRGMSMNWLVEEDETDKLFMKEYKLRDVVGNLKKRVGEVQKLDKSKLY